MTSLPLSAERLAADFMSDESFKRNWDRDVGFRIKEVAEAHGSELHRLAAHHLGYHSNTASDVLSRLRSSLAMPRESLAEFSKTGDKALIRQIKDDWTPSDMTIGWKYPTETLLWVLDFRFIPGILAASRCCRSITASRSARLVKEWKRRIRDAYQLVSTTAELDCESDDFKHLISQEKLLQPIITEIFNEIAKAFDALEPLLEPEWRQTLLRAMYGDVNREDKHA